ncbi:MAG: signal peptide peptidase SppA [Spirochaetaceae bacterium]|jgi:protease-4|nr:signal peptide peptidase SppA [Spirochaetaceae bacterium]
MKARNAGVIIFVCIIFAALAVAVMSFSGSPAGGRGIRARISGSDYIACVYVRGVIEESNRDYNQDWLLRTVGRLRDDKRNLGILLVIDSPGGAVYQADEAYLALRDYAESGKALRAYLGPIAASGGYYGACAAERITANRNTLTGSIGVISGRSIDLTGLMSRYGIKVTTITSGKNKNMLNFDSPLTEEQRSVMQSIADECYGRFVTIVARSRLMSEEEVKVRSDGRVYTAKQALNLGLVDSIDSLEGAAEKFTAELGSDRYGKKIDVVDFDFKPPRPLMDFLTGRSRPQIPELELLRLAPQASFPAYLYTGPGAMPDR